MTEVAEPVEQPTRPERTGPAVYDAIAAVMLYMSQEGISKDRQSGDGGGPRFKFRGIDDIYNALSGVMAANRLMMLPRVLNRGQVERATQRGGVLFYTTVEMEFDLVSADDGTKHTVRTYGEAMDSSDKSTSKAQSAAYKYAAMQVFCIPTEGDNDADASSHDVAPRNQGSGSAQSNGGTQSRANRDTAPKDENPEDSAKRYAANFIKWMDDCQDIKLLDEKIAAEQRGIARLKTDYPRLFSDFDHAKGLAYGRLDDVPF